MVRVNIWGAVFPQVSFVNGNQINPRRRRNAEGALLWSARFVLQVNNT